MAEDRRKYSLRVRTGERVVVGVTNPGCFDFHQHFASLRTLQIDFFDGEWRGGFPGDGGFGFHGFLRDNKNVFCRNPGACAPFAFRPAQANSA